MALQKVINTKLAAGVEGGLYDDSPRRAESKRLHANSGVAAALGRAFTQGATEDDVTVGGEGVFAGIALNDGTVALHGGLTATLEVLDGTVASVARFAHVWVKSETQVAIGNVAAYAKATGKISAYATASAIPGETHVEIPHATFRSSGAAGELVKLELGD